MARAIAIVNATQLVTSDSHPEGILSNASGFPVTIDSNNSPYNGDIEYAMKAAKAAYFKKLGQNYEDTNPNRAMTTVTLEMANGEQILSQSIGGYPEIVPPEPEPEPEPEEPEDEPEPEGT